MLELLETVDSLLPLNSGDGLIRLSLNGLESVIGCLPVNSAVPEPVPTDAIQRSCLDARLKT